MRYLLIVIIFFGCGRPPEKKINTTFSVGIDKRSEKLVIYNEAGDIFEISDSLQNIITAQALKNYGKKFN